MTEGEWLACDDLSDVMAMLIFVRLRATDRQLRLFGCACCRLVWDHLPAWARQAVEAGERYADERLDESKRHTCRRSCNEALKGLRGSTARLGEAAADLLRSGFSHRSAMKVARLARTGRDAFLLPRQQCEFLRDLFGNPFRPVRIDPSWRTLAVVAIARAIDEESAFDRLPILADALEEVACSEPALLAHCREGGAHCRGCWAIDRLRGKEQRP
jgi:hypothetical protein